MAGVGVALAAGTTLGFLAERRLVRPRVTAPAPRREPPLGSLAGHLEVVDGPGGLGVVVESYGPSDAPQLVLSHGWVCTGRVWHEQVAALADRYRIITYDQPGHGRTGAPGSRTYDLDLIGDTLCAVIEATARPGPLVVAGHSMGGMAVLNAARRRPDVLAGRLAGAVLLSTTSSAKSEKLTLEVGIQAAARLERGLRRIVPTLRDPRVLGVTGRITEATSDLSYLVARATSVGPDPPPGVVEFTLQLTLDSGPDIVLGLVEAVLGVDEDESLTCLTMPTTIVVGDHDRLTPPGLSRRMAQRCGADLVVLAGVGHMAPLEAPEAVNDVLERHLSLAAEQASETPGPRPRGAGTAA
jgi:pimeloyl-ACP methyl ester carboxylesterase